MPFLGPLPACRVVVIIAAAMDKGKLAVSNRVLRYYNGKLLLQTTHILGFDAIRQRKGSSMKTRVEMRSRCFDAQVTFSCVTHVKIIDASIRRYDLCSTWLIWLMCGYSCCSSENVAPITIALTSRLLILHKTLNVVIRITVDSSAPSQGHSSTGSVFLRPTVVEHAHSCDKLQPSAFICQLTAPSWNARSLLEEWLQH